MKHGPDRQLEALLALERARKGPSGAARDRVRRRVRASIILPPLPPTPHAPPAPPAIAPPPTVPVLPTAASPSLVHTVSTFLGTAGPVTRAVALLASIAAAGTGLERVTRPVAPASPSVTAVATPMAGGAARQGDLRPTMSLTPAVDVAVEPVPSTALPALSSTLPSTPPMASLPVARVGNPPSSASPAFAAPLHAAVPRVAAPDDTTGAAAPDSVSTGTLPQERALLDAARAALRSGDTVGALRDLDRHAHRFPSGVLVEERDAMSVQALVAASRYADARAAGARFRAAHPGSLLEPAVDDVLQSIP